MKKFFSVLLILSLVFVAVGCGSDTDSSKDTASGDQAGKAIVLKAGHTLAEDHPYQLGMLKFAELVSEKTNGQIKIEVFPNSALGGERDMVEGVQLGTVDMVLSSTGPLGGFVPELNVVDLPFLFKSREHAYKVLDGEIGQDLLKGLENKSLVGLAWWENGFRNVTNNKRPIEKPEDLEGLKIRTMENEVHMASFETMGADPTPMAFNELFTALQQGVVDGEENPVPIVMTSKFYEVQKYMTLTGHFYSPSVVMINKAKFDSFTEEQQNALKEAAKEAADYERGLIKQMDEEFVGQLKEKGMEIIENPDKALFLEAVKPVYEKYESKFGKELIESIQKAGE